MALLCLLVLTASLRAEPGAVDSGFAEGGALALTLGGGANAVAWQSDGKIIVGGSFGVTRLHQDGGLDASFGKGGLVTIALSTNRTETVGALLRQRDGKIVVSVGTALVRVLPSGALDSSFGQGGFAIVPAVTNRSDSITAIALQSDGKIIAGGLSSLQGGGVAFLVLRFNEDGSTDPTFGSGGRAMTTFGSSLAVCRAMAVQGDGGILAGGGARVNGHLSFGLALFTTTGVLDAGFGNGGEAIVAFAGANFSQINGLAFQSDGRIIAAGVCNGANAADLAVARLNQNGSLDDSFGEHGIRQTDFSQGSTDVGVAVEVMPGDRIIVVGSTGPDIFKRRFALAQYDPDGNLDGSFGRGGLVSTQFPLSDADEASALAIAGDGRVILAGRSSVNGADACALVRYHVNDLSAVETASADPVAVGDTIYYSAVVENHRLNGATGVRLTDQLPSSVHFQSVISTQGNCTNIGDLVVCDLGSLASGGQATVTIFATMHATAHLCNSLMVSANETDPALTNSAFACVTVDPLREKPDNLAVTAIRAPKSVVLDVTRHEVVGLVAVEIQNRSPRVETIADLNGVVDLEVRSLTNSCPNLVPVLLTGSPQVPMPVFLLPKAKLSVYFRVTYSKDCVPDPKKTKLSEAHNDYEYVARVHTDAVNDNRDTFPRDDTCPRSPVGNVTTAGSTIKDMGCGGKVYLSGFGAPVVTDVIVK